MKQFTVAAVNGGMIGHRCAKAAQQDIARLCRGQGHPVKACDRHIVQVKVLTVAPPVILTLKIRHINSRQMVGIPEQRVTVRHPVLKAPSCQMWHTAEFMNVTPGRPATRAVRFFICSRRSASLSQGSPTGMTVDQCHNLPLHLCPQPVFRCDTKIRLRLCRDIHTRDIPFPPPACLSRSRTTPQAHTAGHAPESLIQSVS